MSLKAVTSNFSLTRTIYCYTAAQSSVVLAPSSIELFPITVSGSLLRNHILRFTVIDTSECFSMRCQNILHKYEWPAAGSSCFAP